MNEQTAASLIASGQKLIFVRHMGGPYFLCSYGYSEDLNARLSIIPSWTWRRPHQAFRIHYLDLPILEAESHKAGYVLEYDQPDVLKQLKGNYIERRAWRDSDKDGVLNDILKSYIERGKDIPNLTPKMNRELAPEQLAGARFMWRTKRALNCDGMGVGKSYQAVGAIVLNKINGTPYKTLILCPTSVKGSWAKEVAFAGGLSCLILSSNFEERTRQIATEVKDADVVVCSFDGFDDDYLELAAQGFAILVVDEVHRISNRDNNLTQRLIGGRKIKKTFIHVAKPHSIYLMTGTPISNRLDDIYPMLRLLDPGILTWGGFLNRYTLREQGVRWEWYFDHVSGTKKRRPREFMQVVGYQNEKELKAKLSLHMIRRPKDVVLKNLPPKTFETIDVELGPEERKVYDDLRTSYRAEIRGKKVEVKSQLSWMTRAQQICDSLEIVEDSKAKKSSKLDALLKLVDAKVKAGSKVVIFTRFKEMSDIIVRELAHLNPCHFHGALSDKKRQPTIDAFQEDPKRKVFVSTIQAGGVGITLTAADTVVLYDRWWTPGMNFQAVDRLHRRGQTKPVTAYIMRVKDSFEQHIESVWMRKQELVQSMVGDEAVLGDLIKDMTKDEKENLI